VPHAAWCHGVRDEIVGLTMEAMICEHVHVVGPNVEHVQHHFVLGQKMMPLVDGEVGMRTP
jgi:hypothetical protein